MKKKKKIPRVEKSAWGVVVVTAGEHEHAIGYYDDIGERASDAVVYLYGAPFAGPWYEIPLRHLRPATKEEISEYQKTHGMRDLVAAQVLGVPEDAQG